MWLFRVTILGVFVHLVPYLPRLNFIVYGRGWDSLLVFAAAALPAVGAALAAINNLGEFQRLAKRSRAMSANFDALEAELKTLGANARPPRLADLAPIATRMASAMIDEVSDWRIVVNDRAAASG